MLSLQSKEVECENKIVLKCGVPVNNVCTQWSLETRQNAVIGEDFKVESETKHLQHYIMVHYKYYAYMQNSAQKGIIREKYFLFFA